MHSIKRFDKNIFQKFLLEKERKESSLQVQLKESKANGKVIGGKKGF